MVHEEKRDQVIITLENDTFGLNLTTSQQDLLRWLYDRDFLPKGLAFSAVREMDWDSP